MLKVTDFQKLCCVVLNYVRKFLIFLKRWGLMSPPSPETWRLLSNKQNVEVVVMVCDFED